MNSSSYQPKTSVTLDMCADKIESVHSSMPKRGSTLACFFLLSAFISHPLFGATYELIAGAAPVCHIYQQYLNGEVAGSQSQAAKTAEKPEGCDLPVPRSSKGMSRPEWQSLAATDHRNLVARIEGYFQVPLNVEATIPSRSYPANEPPIGNDGLRAISLELTSADVDNDGRPEPVLRFRSDKRCRSAKEYRYGGWSAPLLVLAADLDHIDVKRTAPLMRNPNKVYAANHAEVEAATADRRSGKAVEVPQVQYKYSPYAAGDTHYRSYDIFEVSGSTYFQRWVADPSAVNYQHLTIFRMQGETVSDECEFKYRDAHDNSRK